MMLYPEIGVKGRRRSNDFDHEEDDDDDDVPPPPTTATSSSSHRQKNKNKTTTAAAAEEDSTMALRDDQRRRRWCGSSSSLSSVGCCCSSSSSMQLSNRLLVELLVIVTACLIIATEIKTVNGYAPSAITSSAAGRGGATCRVLSPVDGSNSRTLSQQYRHVVVVRRGRRRRRQQQQRPPTASIVVLSATASSTTDEEDSSDDGTSQQVTGGDEFPNQTLYDILGVSPKDTQEQIRERYRILAKEYHPDAITRREKQLQKAFYLKKKDGDGDSTSSQQQQAQPQLDITDINAAYQILSNPKERRKYDRELQAKDFEEGFEETFDTLVKWGVDNAIPFIQKTANATTQTVVSNVNAVNVNDAASSLLNGVQSRVLSTLNNNNNDQQDPAAILEKRAEIELRKASNLKEQIANLPNTRNSLLQKQSQSQPQQQIFTSSNAMNIMNSLSKAPSSDIIGSSSVAGGSSGSKGITGITPLPSLTKDITTFQENERVYYETNKQYETIQRDEKVIERKVEQTIRATEIAQQNLINAQNALREAQIAKDMAQKQLQQTQIQKKKSFVELDKTQRNLNTIRDKVKIGLYSFETKSIELRTKLLRNVVMDLEISAKRLMKEAKLKEKKNQDSNK